MSESHLQDLRTGIDQVDRQLLSLFEQRMALARQVGEYKRLRNLPVRDAGREEALLEDRAAQVTDASLKEAARAFFAELMRLSRQAQEALIEAASAGAPVAYQGIAGAYGHQAALGFFGADAQLLPCERFEDVFAAVAAGRASRGVVPLENSSSGTIAEVYDLLGRYGLWIVGEERVHVRHCLMGLAGASLEEITTVYSHEQGFLQCAAFLDQYPHWQRIPCFNTAVAARRVAQEGDPRTAAIASKLAAQAYGLEVMQEDIHTFQSNYTRFIIISAKGEAQGSKASLTFTLRHQRGTLHRALASFVALGLSMTRIESRPIPEAPWEYRFYVDVEGALSPQRIQVLLEVLAEDCASCALLGVYEPAGEDAHEA